MSVLNFFSALVAIARAIPTVNDWIEQIVDLWIDYKIENHRDLLNKKQTQRKALQKAIRNAQTDAERIALSITLYEL